MPSNLIKSLATQVQEDQAVLQEEQDGEEVIASQHGERANMEEKRLCHSGIVR